MIRVGIHGKTDVSQFPDYYQVLSLTKSTPYGCLSPYCLNVIFDEDKGQTFTTNMENAWQFSKVYANVPSSVQRRSRYDQTVIWSHPAETHVTNDKNNNRIQDKYWLWRWKGFSTKEAVRYPVGFDHRHKCLYSLWFDNDCKYYRVFDYIEARKNIYLPLYLQSVVKQPKFQQLKDKLSSGQNLLILEVDGPHQESLEYYKNKYHVDDNFIVNSTVLVTQTNMDIMLHDSKHPFGHGYCLAVALLP
jgi:hypothetical protein